MFRYSVANNIFLNWFSFQSSIDIFRIGQQIINRHTHHRPDRQKSVTITLSLLLLQYNFVFLRSSSGCVASLKVLDLDVSGAQSTHMAQIERHLVSLWADLAIASANKGRGRGQESGNTKLANPNSDYDASAERKRNLGLKLKANKCVFIFVKGKSITRKSVERPMGNGEREKGTTNKT